MFRESFSISQRFCIVNLQVNFVTAYLDTSLLYGSTEEANKAIRLFKEGAMKFRDVNGNIYPPNVNKPALLCRIAQKDDICIQSGNLSIQQNSSIFFYFVNTVSFKSYFHRFLRIHTIVRYSGVLSISL